MIKVEVVKEFTLGKFDELKNIKRADVNKDEKGWLYVNDTFECSEEMVKYLTGDNKNNVVVVRVLEVIPEPKKEQPEIKKVELSKPIKTESKITKKTVTKKTSKK